MSSKEFALRALTEAEGPDEVWREGKEIISAIRADVDFALLERIYADVMRLFEGGYPGYEAIATPYHDRQHTLTVFLCSVRLLHGFNLSGQGFSRGELVAAVVAALFHDVGYARRQGEEGGSGAQFTREHVQRGVEFMHAYFKRLSLPAEFSRVVESVIRATDHRNGLQSAEFPNTSVMRLGQVVGTADLVGQMADRMYLEKLLFLYFEFKEAQLGDFDDMHELLCRTRSFYTLTQDRLDTEFGRAYEKLSRHFKALIGQERNLYMEAIQRNLHYLEKIIQAGEGEYLFMLKRGGITERALAMEESLPGDL